MRYLLIVVILFISCKKESKSSLVVKDKTSKAVEIEANFDFTNSKKISLTADLREISGLSYANNAIYTHNDEQGIIFKINPENGKTLQTYNFGKDDDYEGIAIANDIATIIKSNGDISFYNLNNEQLTLHKTKFKKHNDVEGLCVNLSNKNELLIACKGQMLKDDSKNKAKAIYTYNILSNKLETNPFLVIKDSELLKKVKKQYTSIDISKKKFKKITKRVADFSPSGIAMHPSTQEIFIISARGSTLVIYDANKNLKEIILLNEKQLPQPEGICFDNETNLYISTESKGSEGRLYKFENLN